MIIWDIERTGFNTHLKHPRQNCQLNNHTQAKRKKELANLGYCSIKWWGRRSFGPIDNIDNYSLFMPCLSIDLEIENWKTGQKPATSGLQGWFWWAGWAASTFAQAGAEATWHKPFRHARFKVEAMTAGHCAHHTCLTQIYTMWKISWNIHIFHESCCVPMFLFCLC